MACHGFEGVLANRVWEGAIAVGTPSADPPPHVRRCLSLVLLLLPPPREHFSQLARAKLSPTIVALYLYLYLHLYLCRLVSDCCMQQFNQIRPHRRVDCSGSGYLLLATATAAAAAP